MSPRLIAALEYAEQGIKVFPCKPGTKRPCFNKPFENATTDPDIIRGWFDWLGDVNIAYCPEDNGRCVADIDMKNGVDGMASWEALPFEKPVTYTVGTPTDGYHYHYLGSLRPTVGVVGLGIDTRGIRSLALLPPSCTVDGEYIELIPAGCAPVPDGLVELAKPKQHTRLEAPEGLELDTPWNVQFIRDKLERYVRKGDVAVEGQGGNQRAYDLAVEVLDYGISPYLTNELIGELWNPHCEPPWSDDDLGDIVDHAVKYRQNAIGAKALPDPAQYATSETTQGRHRFPVYTPEEHALLPPIEFWDDHREQRILPKMTNGCAIVVYGGRSSHKTGVLLKELVDMALTKGARVLYIAAEGALGLGTARLPALMKQRGRPLSDLTGKWLTMDAAPDVLNPADMAALHEQLAELEFSPDFITFDTGTRCIGMADINTTAIGTAAIKGMEAVGRPYSATVFYVTHPGKDTERGAIGSKQQENQAFGQYRIDYDEAGTVSLFVEKMKDGPQHFAIPFKVHTDGVPVVVEMTPEERRIALRMAAPRHDELREAVYRVAYERLISGGEVIAKNLGAKFGPIAILGRIKEQGYRNATEKDVREALSHLHGTGMLAGGDGDGYHIGTAAKAPDTLQ